MNQAASNVDPAELAKFSDLAHRWWDPESEFRPLHQINPLRLEWIHGLADLTGKQVVDVGCGGGILADAMARKGAQVLGIDLASVPKHWPKSSLSSLMWSPVWKCWSMFLTPHRW